MGGRRGDGGGEGVHGQHRRGRATVVGNGKGGAEGRRLGRSGAREVGEGGANGLRRWWTQQIASTRTLEYGQVCMATNNVFNRCKELSKIAHPNLTNPMDQLEVVGNYVADLGHIIKLYQSRSAGRE